jgi:hypothetical protein
MNINTTFLLFAGLILNTNLLTSSAIAKNINQPNLVSMKTNSSISIDGLKEKSWNKSKPLNINLSELPYKPNNGYKGIKETTIAIRSLYDSENIYFLLSYKDPTKSLKRFPWEKQVNGTWKQLSDKDNTGHDNTYYEDKMAFFWEIKARGFKKKGCEIACHMNENGKVDGINDTSAGRKYTRKPGETIDMWHWKSVRSNPIGKMDDQFVDDTKDPAKNKNWGRKGDDKLGGGYKNNVNSNKSAPIVMNKSDRENNPYWVMQNLKTPFVDKFSTGDTVPGIILGDFTGSRGDINSKGKWANGIWTIEIERKLVTSGKNAKLQDVQFDNTSKKYNFGLSVFDNTQINHLYHDGSIVLTFK